MKNKKMLGYYVGIWVIAFVIFNAFAFAKPHADGYSSSFWIGYIFTVLAFLGQLVCGYIMHKTDSKDKFFLNIPVLTIGFTGLIAIMLVSSLCMLISGIPEWISAIVCVVAFGFSTISVLNAKAAAEMVSDVEKEVKAKTFFIKSLAIDAEALMNCAQTPEAKAEARKIFEAIKYSDPMSDDALNASEAQITLKFADFSDAIISGDPDSIKSSGKELAVLINDRNKKCMLLK